MSAKLTQEEKVAAKKIQTIQHVIYVKQIQDLIIAAKNIPIIPAVIFAKLTLDHNNVA
jgi:hypothetical protein